MFPYYQKVIQMSSKMLRTLCRVMCRHAKQSRSLLLRNTNATDLQLGAYMSMHQCHHVKAVSLHHLRNYSTSPQEAAQMQTEDPSTSSDLMESLTSADQRRLKVLQLEYDVFASTGTLVPEDMTDERWLHILHMCHSYTSRRKQYSYWFKLDMTRRNEIIKKAERQKRHQEKIAAIEKQKAEGTFVIPERIMLRVLDKTMNQHYYNNLAYAMMYGLPLVFDLSYEQKMSQRELKNLIEQILMAHGVNKIQRDPYHVILCNAPEDGYVVKQMRRYQMLDLERVPITITEKSYSELFPKKQLVYLSPNAPTVLKSFNPDDVYIIGGIVDTSSQEPLTYAQAKRDNIRSAKLPLDHYLNWGLGSKSLTVDQMMKIMLQLKDSNDWTKAFSCVPQRKLR